MPGDELSGTVLAVEVSAVGGGGDLQAANAHQAMVGMRPLPLSRVRLNTPTCQRDICKAQDGEFRETQNAEKAKTFTGSKQLTHLTRETNIRSFRRSSDVEDERVRVSLNSILNYPQSISS